MNILKKRGNSGSNIFANVLSNHVLKYPTPSNINYNWSFGALAGIFFAGQIITGILLAMHYTPHIDFAFYSVEHIMTDVNYGYIFRYAHANGASMVFIFLYCHMGRGLYYQSYVTRPQLWYTGLVLFLLMMATAFIGYVLPWGQMSFWGATVITSLVTAIPFIGEDIAHWVWGGFSINNATLNRFFSLHYLLPFLITGLVVIHLVILHTTGSSETQSVSFSADKISFHPFFTWKDIFITTFGLLVLCYLIFFNPNLLGHSDNFIPANPLVTPAHIVPEWYFLPFYAILRACPDKVGGALSMLFSILVLFTLPTIYKVASQEPTIIVAYSDIHKIGFWGFVGVFFTLMFLGSNVAAAPFIIISKHICVMYFGYFLLWIPSIAALKYNLTFIA